MTSDFVKRDLKPFGVLFRMNIHVGGDVVKAHVFPCFHLVGVDDWGSVALAEPHVVEFVFGEAEADGSLIYKGEDFVHVASHTQFFL